MRPNPIRLVNLLLIVVVLIAYFAVTGWDNLFAALFLFAFTMSPLVVNAIVAAIARARAAQYVLLCTTLAYAAWASVLYMDATASRSDGQGGFTLLLIAIAASPVLIIAWVACLIIEIFARKKIAVGRDRARPTGGSPLPQPT